MSKIKSFLFMSIGGLPLVILELIGMPFVISIISSTFAEDANSIKALVQGYQLIIQSVLHIIIYVVATICIFVDKKEIR